MSAEAYTVLVLVPLLILLTICVYTDMRRRLIYDWCTIPAMIYFLLIHIVYGSFADSLLGLLGVGLVIYALAWITRGGIGGGDIKLYAALGAAFGFTGGLWIAAIATIAAAFSAMPLLLLRRFRRLPAKYHELPMAPFIAAGTAAIAAFHF